MQVIRVKNIELSNFKNVGHGIVDFDGKFDQTNSGSITGVYGQNGSGKTALLSGINLVKNLISGNPLPNDSEYFIKKGEKAARVKVEFYLNFENREYQLIYDVVIGYTENTPTSKENIDVNILEEKLTYRSKGSKDSSWSNLRTLLKVNIEKVTPLIRNTEISNLFEKEYDFPFLIRDSFRKKKSLIFTDELVEIIKNNNEILSDEYRLFGDIQFYANTSLFVIENKQLGVNYANVMLPINVKHEEGNETTYGIITINLMEATEVDADVYLFIERLFVSINKIITELIPGLTISVNLINEKLDQENKLKKIFELMSVRDGFEIPIRYESDGIKKLISIINQLTATYNNKSMSLFIDELDSGIFEYLLGEILVNYQNFGKGQLVFTSHNLRPLELLSKDNLYFTTTNPNNRYLQFKNLKDSNNLRDSYFRNILLGGQAEELYKPTRTSNIRRAFRLSEVTLNGE